MKKRITALQDKIKIDYCYSPLSDVPGIIPRSGYVIVAGAG